MSKARDSAIRLLQLTMIASVILPAALLAYASWFTYREVHAVADERITRSLDVMQEQSLKVFQTVDRTFAEVNEIVRGMSDAEIRAAQPRLQPRLSRIVAAMPQLYAILLVGGDGKPLVASMLASVPTDVLFDDRDYFQAQIDHDAGTYVSDTRSPRLPGIGADFFDLSRRLESPDGSFSGVIAVAVRPGYFEDFYAPDRADARQLLRPGALRRLLPRPLSAGRRTAAGGSAARAACARRSRRAPSTASTRSPRRSTAFPGASAFASFRASRSMRLPG